MPRAALSRHARLDLESIFSFSLKTWGAARAGTYLDALEDRLAQLARQPQVGRSRDDLASGLLSFPFESHVVFYRPSESGITVVRILHARQDARRRLR